MKYIKTFESFKFDKSDKVDEGFLGKLFGKMKNKLSMGFSKQFGSAKEVDKLMGEYKAEIMKAEGQKKNILVEYGKYLKSVKDGGEVDENKAKEVGANYKKAEVNFDKQLEIIKQKFDIKFKEIMDEEENDKIKNFVTLKKLEMQQEILQNELSTTLTDAGLKDEDVKDDPFFQGLVKGIQGKMAANNKTQEEQKTALSAEGGEEGDEELDIAVGGEFMYKNSKDVDIKVEVIDMLSDDEKKVQVKSEKGTKFAVDKGSLKKVEEGEESESEEKTYNAGDEITYDLKDGGENKAKVADSQDGVADGRIKVVTKNSPDGVDIEKDKIK
jgi:hypothetical protein